MIGVFTYLDLALIAVALISGMIAMYRGLTSELLAILSWIAAGAVGYWIYSTKADLASDIAGQTGLPPQIAAVVVALVVALIVLIIVHLITARFADSILDSQVGMIDRVLGFVFGLARGFLLFVIPYMAYEAFITADKEHQNPMVRDAYFRDSVKATGDAIRSVLLQVLPQPTAAPQESPPPGQQQGLIIDGKSYRLAYVPRAHYMTAV